MRKSKRFYISLIIISLFVMAGAAVFFMIRNEPSVNSHSANRPKPPDSQHEAPHEKPGNHPHGENGELSSDEILYYRGSRTLAENEPLIINRAECKKTDESTATLEITFNQSINPKSVNHTSIFVDGKPLPDGTRFSFNKKGDTIKLTISSKDGETIKGAFTVHVQNISSFDGTDIEPVDIQVTVE